MKKLLIGIFTVIMMITQTAFAFGSLHDIGECENVDEIKLLYNLGIVRGDENSNFLPENRISRIEFATMVLRFLNLSDMAASIDAHDNFIDIPASHWAYKNAEVLKQTKICDGLYDGYFGAEDNVTYEQAIKMLVSALGYRDNAEKKGGFPNGYLEVANTLRIGKDVPIGDAVKRADAAKLFVNALTVKIRGNADVTDETTLDVLGVTVKEGLVTSTYSMQADMQINYDEIAIDNEKFKINCDSIIDTENLFGQRIKYYVKTVDSIEKIIHIEQKGQAKVKKIEADDIDKDSTSQNKICYKNGKKMDSVNISDVANVYYNGKILESSYINDKTFAPEEGSVTLYDLDQNGDYETVQVIEYETLVVSKSNETKLYDRYGNSIDFEKYDNVRFYDNGKEITYGDIKANDVVSVARDKKGKNADVFVCREHFTGKVIALSDDGYDIQKSDGTVETYELSGSLAKAIRLNYFNVNEIKLNLNAEFYLNISGKIADAIKVVKEEYDLEDTDDSAEFGMSRKGQYYGFVWESSYKNHVLYLRILSKDNKYEVLSTEKDAKINFGRRENGKYVHNKVSAEEVYSKIASIKQIITYMLSDDGKLTELCIADNDKNNNEYLCESYPYTRYPYKNRAFNQYYWVDQNTVIFNLPEFRSREQYNSVSRYEDIFSNGKEYYVTMYDVEDDGRIGAIVYETASVIEYTRNTGGYEIYIDPANSNVMYVEKVYNKDVDGVSRTVVEGYEDGEKITQLLADTLNENSESRDLVKKGAVIQYETNSITVNRAINADTPEQIVLIKLIMDFNADNPKKTTYGYQDTLLSRISGTYALDDEGLVVSYGNIVGISDAAILMKSNKNIILRKNLGTMVLSYNKESKTFKIRSLDDLAVGMEIYARQRNNNVIDIVYFE